MSKKRKVVRYRKRIHINIGIIVFTFVFIYFLVYLISFLTANHVSAYEVQQGQISQKISYTGLILRNETVQYAEESGSVNYYKKEKDKAGVNDLICSIDKNGNISEQITQAGLDGSKLDADGLSEIQDFISDYSISHNDQQFYNVYSFKESVNAKIQEDLYNNALEALTEQASDAASKNTFSFIRTKTDGILAFYTDGYESVTPESFTADMYNPASYTKVNLKSNTSVTSGQALYKIVNDETWYMMVPISSDDVTRYEKELDEGEQSFVIHVVFDKDKTEAYATAEIKKEGKQNFLLLTFQNSMVRFLSDRYMEIELGTTNISGLKIPNTAITEKEFLVIPKEYVGKGDNSSSSGVLKVNKDKKGKETIEFITTDLYKETEKAYYISESDLSVGDVLQKQGSSDLYTIEDTAKLKGVYNINKGYAVFKLIQISAKNEEYTIVKTGTSYGLSQYDRIALDGSSVKEGELAH